MPVSELEKNAEQIISITKTTESVVVEMLSNGVKAL